MTTLAEIEAAADALSPEQKQELLLFLAASLRSSTATPPEPRAFSREQIETWINQDNAEIIRQYLETRGYKITVAHSGDEALALFETVRPALVLLDVMMPGRDGWEVCRIMKQHPTLGRTVRIVMVTALDEWQDKREALQLGADDYVEKPFELPTLAATVQRNLAMQRAKAS